MKITNFTVPVGLYLGKLQTDRHWSPFY